MQTLNEFFAGQVSNKIASIKQDTKYNLCGLNKFFQFYRTILSHKELVLKPMYESSAAGCRDSTDEGRVFDSKINRIRG